MYLQAKSNHLTPRCACATQVNKPKSVHMHYLPFIIHDHAYVYSDYLKTSVLALIVLPEIQTPRLR